MMIFLLKFVFCNRWAKCVEFTLPTVLLVDSQPRRAHYFAKQSIVGYTLLISLSFASHLLPKFFSTLCIKKHSWKNHFQLVSDFIFLPPSFYFFLRFCSYESTEDKLSLYLIWTFASRFAGVFRKSFYSLTIIGKLRAVCRGISRKFYKKIAENFSRQPHIKRKSDIIQTSFSVFIKLFFIVLKALLRSLPFFRWLTIVS